MSRSLPSWRVRAAGLVSVLLLTTVSGCGDPGQDYCDALRKDQSQLDEMIGSTSVGALLSQLPLLRRLAEKAPDDLTDEWQRFLNAVESLHDALRNAGLSASDFKGGKVPDAVQGEERRSLIGAADELSSAEVVDAAQGIEAQARDVCKVNLGV